MKRVVVTVAKVTDASFRLFEDQGIRVLGLFGAGEGLIMVTDPDDPPEVRQHALGTPVHELDVVRILEPGAEEPCPDGTIGELCFTGPYTLRGYLRAPERNVEAFTSDGLYRSGDLVAARAIAGRRSYVFEGRAKDLINRGGEKINAAEVEALVAEIRGVRRVALIPVPDERLGERACLCLEVEDLAEAPDLHQVTTHLADLGVAKFKWPERLVVLPDLPRTKIGKIDKRGLIDIVVGSPPLAPVENV